MTRDRGPQPDQRPQPPRQARSPGVTAGKAHLDPGAIGQRAFQPRAAVRGQLADRRALTPEPGHEFGRARQNRRRAEKPAHQPSSQQPAEEHDQHGERRQRAHGQPAEQQRRNRARPPARPVRTPGQVGPHHERDERGVHHEYRGIAAVQHRTFDRAVLGPPDSRRDDGSRGAGEPGDGRVARVPPLAADHHHHGDDRQDETRDPGHHLGRERQPARDVMQPGRDIVGQFRAAERKSPDIAEHHRDDRQREHREQQVGRAAHAVGTVRHPGGVARRASREYPAGRGLLHAGIGPAGRLVPSARHHDIRLPGVTPSTPPSTGGLHRACCPLACCAVKVVHLVGLKRWK